MKILFVPSYSDDKNGVQYKRNGDKLEIEGILYDFSNLPDGELINTIPHFRKVERINKQLFAEVIYYVNQNSTQDELFPDWFSPETTKLSTGLVNGNIEWYSDTQKKQDEENRFMNPSRLEKMEMEILNNSFSILMLQLQSMR